MNSSVNPLAVIWMISVSLEPFLLFSVNWGMGITTNISRLFQLVVFIIVSLNFLHKSKFVFSSFCVRNFLPYIYLMSYISIITLISYAFNNDFHESSMGDIFFNRTFLEIIILWGQFFYFCILAIYFLKNKLDFQYFFYILFFLFIINFLIGWVDYFLSSVEIYWVPRHFSDGVFVGNRFHGIAGEPRDAAVIMLCVFFLYAIWSAYIRRNFSYPQKWIIFLLLISLYVTFSASLMIAILISAVLIFIYNFIFSFRRMNRYSIGILILFAIILISTFMFSERVYDYYFEYKNQLSSLISNSMQPNSYLVKASYNNFYPLLSSLNEISQLNIVPSLFGHGLGASGVLNSQIYGEFYNPNAQVIRLIYDYGLLGTIWFVYSYFYFLIRSGRIIDSSTLSNLIVVSIIMLSAYMAHRTNIFLILLGLMAAVSNYHNLKQTKGLDVAK